MTALRDAARQALEALEHIEHHYISLPKAGNKAVNALRAALAQQEQEPVAPYAWMAVGGTIWRRKTSEDDVPLYTHPPRREWRSLSEGEVASCWAKGFEACKDQTVGDLRMHIARAIEAALKEKNQ
jgi:hypothetical protein